MYPPFYTSYTKHLTFNCYSMFYNLSYCICFIHPRRIPKYNFSFPYLSQHYFTIKAVLHKNKFLNITLQLKQFFTKIKTICFLYTLSTQTTLLNQLKKQQNNNSKYYYSQYSIINETVQFLSFKIFWLISAIPPIAYIMLSIWDFIEYICTTTSKQ